MSTMPILVGVDGSEESLRAVEYAAGEARRYGAPLRIVSAPAMLPRMHAYHRSARTVANVMRDVSVRALTEALTRVGEVARGVLADTDLLSGPPAVAVAGSGEATSAVHREVAVGIRDVNDSGRTLAFAFEEAAAPLGPCQARGVVRGRVRHSAAAPGPTGAPRCR